MKNVLLPIILVALFASHASAQHHHSFREENARKWAHTRKIHVNPVTIIGICSAGIGLPMAAIGGLSSASGGGSTFNTPSQAEINTDRSLLVVGIILTVTGGALAIGGGIHDRNARHQRRWSLTAPKKNELGFVYQFR